MAEHPVTLQDGFKIGDKILKNAVIREADFGHYIDAVTESERPVATPQGWMLLASNALIGANMLRRQIVRIDDHQGPLTLAELRALSQRDVDALNEACLAFEYATKQELEKRGRD